MVCGASIFFFFPSIHGLGAWSRGGQSTSGLGLVVADCKAGIVGGAGHHFLFGSVEILHQICYLLCSFVNI